MYCVLCCQSTLFLVWVCVMVVHRVVCYCRLTLPLANLSLPWCRIAVFSVTVFYDERIVIVAEQRPDASEEDSFQWMSRVLQVPCHITWHVT